MFMCIILKWKALVSRVVVRYKHMRISVVLTQSQFTGLGSLNQASILFLAVIFGRRSFFLDAALVQAGEESFFQLAIALTRFLTRAARFLSTIGLLLGRDKGLCKSLERRRTSVQGAIWQIALELCLRLF